MVRPEPAGCGSMTRRPGSVMPARIRAVRPGPSSGRQPDGQPSASGKARAGGHVRLSLAASVAGGACRLACTHGSRRRQADDPGASSSRHHD
ncbi:hypothetical protein AD950_12275 [Gluconobacter oxydans]|nr:hypothetical protein AD950_12275 [Gluconobacter oxydans]